MKNIENLLPADFAAEEEAYSLALQSNGQVKTDLPEWYSEADRWSDFVQSWRDYIQDLYEKYFQPKQKPDLSWVNFEKIFFALYLLFWISVAGLLIYLLLALFKKYSAKPKMVTSEPDLSIETREQRLVEMVKVMMKKGDWAKAAKLRWRLFLERRELSVEMTPLEFERNHSTKLPKAMDQYKNMFTTEKGDEGWYQEYSRQLRNLEGPQ